MKRSVFDILRRGLDNAIANWGLAAVRFTEMFVFVAIAMAVALAMLVPLLVSMGIEIMDIDSPEDVESLILSLYSQWVWLLGFVLVMFVLLIVFVAIHSFVEAGCARVQVDADRAAGPSSEGPRSRYKVFSLRRWSAGGKAGWWTVFWIYNLAWGVTGLILLVPLIPTAVVMLVGRESPVVLIGAGCFGILVTLLLFIVVGTATSMWTTRATAEWAVEPLGASAALAKAWAAIKADVGRHLLIVVAIIVISFAGSSFFASFSYFAAFGELFHRGAAMQIVTIPLRLFGTICNWAFSAFVSSWYLGAYAALAVEGESQSLRVSQPQSGTGLAPL